MDTKKLKQNIAQNRQQLVVDSATQICPQPTDDFSCLAIPSFAEQLFSIPWDHQAHYRQVQRQPSKSTLLCSKN